MNALEVVPRADLLPAPGDDLTTNLFDKVLSLTDYQIGQLATYLQLALATSAASPRRTASRGRSWPGRLSNTCARR